MKLKKILFLLLKISLVGILLFVIGFLAMIRFTSTKITSPDGVIFGYDQKAGKWQVNEKNVYELAGLDGPYLIDGQLIEVNEQNEIVRQKFAGDSLVVRINGEQDKQFKVAIRKNHLAPASTYEQPEKLVAISDIEGNFSAFTSFLIKQGAIDSAYHWSFGEGHLLLNGDFVDRGNNVIPVLWLIYQLEAEAKRAGGMVHFILGNHEIMNIQGDWRYAAGRYKKLAKEIFKKEKDRENYRTVFSATTELGRWLRSKNIVEKIGEYLFVHAGMSPDILDLNIEISEMNELIRENIDKRLYKNPGGDPKPDFLMGTHSPYWYRGLVRKYKYYDRIEAPELDRVLDRYQVKRIVIGHTVVEEVSTDFEGKVIRIDVKHGTEEYSPQTQGLFLENGVPYRVDAAGGKIELR